MKGEITERIQSIVVGELFAHGRPREEPAVMRSDIAGVNHEVVMTPLIERVEYTYRRWTGSRDPGVVHGSIPVSWTFPNYGGRRAWLHCGRCNRRVGRLFLVGDPLLCRSCARIRYASKMQAKPKWAQKLEREGDPGSAGRPAHRRRPVPDQAKGHAPCNVRASA